MSASRNATANASANSNSSLETVKAKLAAAVDANEDDPLSGHVDYINWMQQNKTKQSEIMTAVEIAVRQFRKDSRFKNDLRFLKLWFMVLETTKDKGQVYKYMESNGIGEFLGIFYESYADFLRIQNLFAFFRHS